MSFGCIQFYVLLFKPNGRGRRRNLTGDAEMAAQTSDAESERSAEEIEQEVISTSQVWVFIKVVCLMLHRVI